MSPEWTAVLESGGDDYDVVLVQETRYMRAYLQAASAFVVPRC